MFRWIVAASLAASCTSLSSAQQYVDERVPIDKDGSTASTTDLIHGDIDGDGWDDLVVRESGSYEVIVAGAPGEFAVTDFLGGDSNGSAIADFNGDGRGDLLSQETFSLGWYPELPDGSVGGFQPIQAKGSKEVFWSKGAGDVNGDGNIDAIASLSTDSFGSMGVLRWFAGDGSGGFSSPQSTASAPYPIQFRLGDFNADGVLDAAARGPLAAAAFVFYGTGAGFAAPQPVASGGCAGRIASGDFDADGVDDLVCYPTGSFTWFRGGAGGFTLGGTQVIPGATAASDVEAADLNQDGADDVVLAELLGGGNIWRSLGSAGAGLGSPTIAVAQPAMSVAAFEYDGKPGLDLVFTAPSSTWPVLRPGDGAGGFLAPVDLLNVAGCADSDAVCAGDLDRDGALDLVFENGYWRRGVGDGTFLPSAFIGVQASELIDLNGDGLLDAVGLAQNCGGSSGLSVTLQVGGGFGPPTWPSQPPIGGTIDFAIADLDADGDLDLASAGDAGAFTHLNTGTGSFAPYVTTALPAPCSNIGAGDLNGDGLADLARTNYYQPTFGSFIAELGWGLSIGSGQLGSIQQKTLFTTPTGQLLIDDVNDDQLADVVWASSASGQVVAAHGDGTGNLGSLTYLVTTYSSGMLSVALADIDGDGQRDLIGGGGGQVSVARWNGNGYQLWRQIGAGAGAGKLLPYDFDADGQINLAWGRESTVRMALNQRSDPSGTAIFGTGTYGCQGRVSIGSVEPAELSNNDFRLLAHNLPPNAPGWFLLGGNNSVPGIEPPGVGVLLHVDPNPSLVLVPTLADAGGQADQALPIPFDTQLIGLKFYLQVVHSGAGSLGHDCSTSPLSLVSSRGITLTIQP